MRRRRRGNLPDMSWCRGRGCGWVVGAAVALLLGGCGEGLVGNGEGEACAATAECATGLECARIGERRSFCLPEPAARDEKSCATDVDCTLTGEALWPVEARCDPDTGSCRCPAELRACDAGRAFEATTCRCEPE